MRGPLEYLDVEGARGGDQHQRVVLPSEPAEPHRRHTVLVLHRNADQLFSSVPDLGCTKSSDPDLIRAIHPVSGQVLSGELSDPQHPDPQPWCTH